MEENKQNTSPRLQLKYRNEVIPALMKEFGYTNIMQVPRIGKLTLNMGLGSEVVGNPNVMKVAQEQLTIISGQKAVVTKAKKAIANFKIRVGLPIGCMVTLRGEEMWEFLDRLLSVALPRVRDFKGVSGKAFDGKGNYSLGLRELLIFPEVDYDKVDKDRGFNISITTSAKTDREAKSLLGLLGMPFRN